MKEQSAKLLKLQQQEGYENGFIARFIQADAYLSEGQNLEALVILNNLLQLSRNKKVHQMTDIVLILDRMAYAYAQQGLLQTAEIFQKANLELALGVFGTGHAGIVKYKLTLVTIYRYQLELGNAAALLEKLSIQEKKITNTTSPEVKAAWVELIDTIENYKKYTEVVSLIDESSQSIMDKKILSLQNRKWREGEEGKGPAVNYLSD